MLETGFVTRSEYQKHIRGEWRTIHNLWPHIRRYVPEWGYSKAEIDAMFAGTEGSIAFADASGFIAEDNANLFWDETNARLGLNQTTPTARIDIVAEANFPGINISAGAVGEMSTPDTEVFRWGHWNAGTTTFTERLKFDAAGLFYVSYLSAGSVIFAGAGGEIKQDNANLRWDDAAKRLGIGKVPANVLDVEGAGTDVGGVVGFDVVIARFHNETAAQHTAISIDALTSYDPVLYFAENGVAIWDIRNDASESDEFNIRYQVGGANDIVFIITPTGDIQIPLGYLAIMNNEELRFYDNGNYVGFEAPALDADQIWILPIADGDPNDFLQTDGAGNLSWAAGGAGAATFVALTDTPANYAGAAKKIVRVNAVPDALEFGANIENLEDVDTLTGQAGKYAKVKVGDAGVEWVVGVGAITEFLDLVDTPPVYTLKRGYVPVVNDAEDALVFIHSKDLPTKKIIDDPPDDEFEAATLDGKWTVVDGASGTVNLIGIAGNIYDLASRRGHLLVQAINGQEFSIRQDYILADGKSIILAVSAAVTCDGLPGVANNEIMVKLSLNDNDASHEAGNYVTLSIDTQTDGMRILYYEGANYYGTSNVANDLTHFGQKFYLRILRDGTTYYGFFSLDCETWVPLYKLVLGGALTNIWITVDSAAAVGTPVPIQAFDWIRLGDDKVCPW